MKPYIGMSHIDIRTDSLSTILDVPNTLNLEYSGTKNVPRDPLNGPVTFDVSILMCTPTMFETSTKYRILATED